MIARVFPRRRRSTWVPVPKRVALVAAFDDLLTLYGTDERPGPEELADTVETVLGVRG